MSGQNRTTTSRSSASHNDDRPAPRPRVRLSPEARREQIIAAAITVVADRGYAAATATTVAATADVAKGMIWRYFDDRDDLLLRTAEHVMVQLRTEITNHLDLDASAPNVIRQALQQLAAMTRSHTTELRALNQIVHNLRTDTGSLRLSIHDYEQGYRLQETLFARGAAEGSLAAADTRVMAVTYQGAIDAMLAYLEAHPEIDPLEYANQLANILLNGFGARPSLT